MSTDTATTAHAYHLVNHLDKTSLMQMQQVLQNQNPSGMLTGTTKNSSAITTGYPYLTLPISTNAKMADADVPGDAGLGKHQ